MDLENGKRRRASFARAANLLAGICLLIAFPAPAATRSVVGWGGQLSGLDLSGPFLGIAAGGLHSLALQPGGEITAWGDNRAGQCRVPAGNSGFIALSAGWAPGRRSQACPPP